MSAAKEASAVVQDQGSYAQIIDDLLAAYDSMAQEREGFETSP